MANFNIPFNNKNYSVDEQSLSSASNSLKSHLSTTMSGSGATINFGGTTYNVDSAKLLAATNDFISHLGTVAGNGYKVIVNGVEYSVGSDKVAGAVSDLEIVLGNLHSEDDGVIKPEKNQYGFYFNVPYISERDSYKDAYIFYENETYAYFCDGWGGQDGMPEDVTELLSNQHNNNICYDSLYEDGWIFSEDGKTMTDCDGNAYVAQDIVEHSIYFGETYTSNDGETFIPYEDNRVVFSNENLGEVTLEGWISNGHYAQNYWARVYVSIDGATVYAGSRYDSLKAYYLDN